MRENLFNFNEGIASLLGSEDSVLGCCLKVVNFSEAKLSAWCSLKMITFWKGFSLAKNVREL